MIPADPVNRPDAANSLARRCTYASCSFFRSATQIPDVIAPPLLEASKFLRALVSFQPFRGPLLDPRFGLAAGNKGADVLLEIRPLHPHEPSFSSGKRLRRQLRKKALHRSAYSRAAAVSTSSRCVATKGELIRSDSGARTGSIVVVEGRHAGPSPPVGPPVRSGAPEARMTSQTSPRIVFPPSTAQYGNGCRRKASQKDIKK
jgi:hypothetical protein